MTIRERKDRSRVDFRKERNAILRERPIQWFPVVIMLTSHQMESANSSNSPRVIIQGVATSGLIAGWSTDCKPLRVNHGFVVESTNPFITLTKLYRTWRNRSNKVFLLISKPQLKNFCSNFTKISIFLDSLNFLYSFFRDRLLNKTDCLIIWNSFVST